MLRPGFRQLSRAPYRNTRWHAARRKLSSQQSAGTDPSTVTRYLVYSVTALAGGVALHKSYASFPASRYYDSRRLHADSPRGFFTGKRSDDSAKDSSAKKDADKSTEKGILTDWSNVGGRIADALVPDWAQELPDYVAKFQQEMSMEPGTLADDIWKQAHNPSVHPEIRREASVRVSDELCDEEKAFLRNRKSHIRKALAHYLDVPEKDIHPDDVPTIAMCGSGGGLRALVAGSSSYLSAQEAGLWDCVTYTAGVSGSCWLQSLYHSSLTDQKFDKLLNHLKSRIGIHIAFPPPVLKLLTNAPTNKFLLAGGLEKYKGFPDAEFGLVDAYGLLLGARLLVPKGELEVDPSNLKLSYQRKYVDNGENPLPIYTAVRHEIPTEEAMSDQGKKGNLREQARKEAWFQWFEFTPYEFWCEELGAGIPTWSVGRHFKDGHSYPNPSDGPDEQESYGTSGYLPEVRIPLLMGIWGSAFCATLAHYYKEIRPLVKGLTGFGGLDQMIEERNEDLVKVHPVRPAQIPNYVVGMANVLPDRVPASIHNTKHIQLMDAGMSNNLPIYPLLRPGRNVDVLIAFDASADIKKENWLRVADGYARQRGIRGWPIGTGWPEDEAKGAQMTGKGIDEAESVSASGASKKLAQAAKEQDERATPAPSSPPKSATSDADSAPPASSTTQHTLGYCTVWVGTTQERSQDTEPPPSKAVEHDWELMEPDAGIAVAYLPFMRNDKVDGVDPEHTEFMSTWNFIYTPEDIDKVVRLARANFDEGAERVRMTIRAVYERKKRQRLQREREDPGWNIA